jgi:hypothetical protein
VLIEDDAAADGFPRLTLRNGLVSVTLSPNAGARAFSFRATTAGCAQNNVFTSVGALRDDVAVQPPLSTTDRIGKYTRSFPAGMFNRPYALEHRAATASAVSVTLAYEAPDEIPSCVRFERTVTLRAADPGFTVDERVTFAAGAGAAAQRAVRYDSFDSSGGALIIDERARGAIGFFYPASGFVASVSWPEPDVASAQIVSERTSTVVRLEFTAAGETRTRYALRAAADFNAARAAVLKDRSALAAKR